MDMGGGEPSGGECGLLASVCDVDHDGKLWYLSAGAVGSVWV